MPFEERKIILENLRAADLVLSLYTDWEIKYKAAAVWLRFNMNEEASPIRNTRRSCNCTFF